MHIQMLSCHPVTAYIIIMSYTPFLSIFTKEHPKSQPASLWLASFIYEPKLVIFEIRIVKSLSFLSTMYLYGHKLNSSVLDYFIIDIVQ